MDHGERMPVAGLAHAIAERAANEMLLAASTEQSGAVLQVMVYRSVMRAFGCSCRHDRAAGDEGVYFEDLVCSLHGIGPIDGHVDGKKKTDPGD